MSKPKFVIITSQYWDEGYTFICEYEQRFLEKAKKTIEKLEEYKRNKENKKDYYYGDLEYFNKDKIASRYNLNDSGDIYFVMAWSIKDLLNKYNKQLDENKCYRKGRRKKEIINACKEHHDFNVIRKIISDNFNLVD